MQLQYEEKDFVSPAAHLFWYYWVVGWFSFRSKMEARRDGGHAIEVRAEAKPLMMVMMMMARSENLLPANVLLQ